MGHLGGNMLLVVGGIKGGSGKTTLATNLAVCRAKIGKKVLLVDGDEQMSALDWWTHRCKGVGFCNENILFVNCLANDIFKEIKYNVSSFDDIIIDSGGRDTTTQRSALVQCDVFLSPFRPKSLDIWTLQALKKLKNEILSVNPSLRTMAVLNQCARNDPDTDTCRVIIEDQGIECLSIPIRDRKSFSDASSKGLGIIEHKSAYRGSVMEILSLHDDIYDGNMLQTFKYKEGSEWLYPAK